MIAASIGVKAWQIVDSFHPLEPAQVVSSPTLVIDDSILELLPIAVCVCDAGGVIVRYNRKAAELWGRSPRVGDPELRFCGAYRLLRPDGTLLDGDQTPMAQVLRTGRSVRGREMLIERCDGAHKWALVNIDPIKNAAGEVIGAVNCLQDLSERKQAAEREAAERRHHEQAAAERERQFCELLEALPAAIYKTDGAGRITYYNQAAIDLWGCRPDLGTSQWCGSWRLYWPDGRPMPHDQCPMAMTLKQNRPVRGEAVAERPDGTRVPFAAYPTPLRNADGALIGAVNMLVDISHRKQAEQHQLLLINELNHRVKNTLATVQSIAAQSFRGDANAAGSRNFEGRLMALSRAHDLLTRENWAGACLLHVVTEATAHLRSPEHDPFVIDGATLRIGPKMALSMAMSVHELGTNAVKYGALSNPAGRVSVCWHVRSDAGGRRLHFRWAETGGPPSRPPAGKGFGSRLIERGLRQELDALVSLEFLPTGVVCQIDAPLP